LPENAKRIAGWEGYYVNVARLTYQKGQWHLLRAFKRLIEKQPEAKLVIVGNGADREGLSKLAECLGIAGSVYFAGQQDNIYPFLHRAKCFVLTSLWEGLPNVILEALALDLPVIAVDSTSGMRELLAPELPLSASVEYPYTASRGVLVAPFPDEHTSTRFLPKDGPYEALADALEAPPSARGGDAIREAFSPHAICAAWQALITPQDP
jgi:glycosyltransferase involved in cell wall biosynthesis